MRSTICIFNYISNAVKWRSTRWRGEGKRQIHKALIDKQRGRETLKTDV